MPEVPRVLFLCTGNSCRSQMADGFINHDFAGQLVAFSAGTEPHGLNPRAVQVMQEVGIDISGNASDHLDRYEEDCFDWVISLCDSADARCPSVVGGARRLHMPFADPPAAVGSEDEVMAVYRQVRDQIRRELGVFFTAQLNHKSQRRG